jgi:hypothetical protein
MIAIAIAVIRYMSGTTDDPKAAPQVREMTKHRSKPRSIEGLTMEIKRERARKGLPEMARKSSPTTDILSATASYTATAMSPRIHALDVLLGPRRRSM